MNSADVPIRFGHPPSYFFIPLEATKRIQNKKKNKKKNWKWKSFSKDLLL